MRPPIRHDPEPGSGRSGYERVIERAYDESGALRWERAGIRTSPQRQDPAVELKPDPIWLEVLGWVLGGFWRGLELAGEAVLTVVLAVVGVVLAVVAFAAAVALVVGILMSAYWSGGQVGGQSGSLTGVCIAGGAMVLTLIGASNRAHE